MNNFLFYFAFLRALCGEVLFLKEIFPATTYESFSLEFLDRHGGGAGDGCRHDKEVHNRYRHGQHDTATKTECHEAALLEAPAELGERDLVVTHWVIGVFHCHHPGDHEHP